MLFLDRKQMIIALTNFYSIIKIQEDYEFFIHPVIMVSEKIDWEIIFEENSEK